MYRHRSSRFPPTYARHYPDLIPDQCKSDSDLQHRWRSSLASHQSILFAAGPISGISLPVSVTSLTPWMAAFPINLCLSNQHLPLAPCFSSCCIKLKETKIKLLAVEGGFCRKDKPWQPSPWLAFHCHPTSYYFHKKKLEDIHGLPRAGATLDSYRTANLQAQTRLQKKELATIQEA